MGLVSYFFVSLRPRWRTEYRLIHWVRCGADAACLQPMAAVFYWLGFLDFVCFLWTRRRRTNTVQSCFLLMAPNGTDCATIADGARLECASGPQGAESLPKPPDGWHELTPEGSAADKGERPALPCAVALHHFPGPGPSCCPFNRAPAVRC